MRFDLDLRKIVPLGLGIFIRFLWWPISVGDDNSGIQSGDGMDYVEERQKEDGLQSSF
jgi:hypothetical protein